MNKYAIFLDLDGTALSSHNHINQELIDTVNHVQNEGHKVFLATGRQYYSAIPFHQQLSLTTPLITLNGGAIYDGNSNSELLHRQTLDDSFLDYILKNDDFNNNTKSSFFDALNLTVATKYDKNINHFFYEQMPSNLEPNIIFKDLNFENRAHFNDTVSIFSMLAPEHVAWANEIVTAYQRNNDNHNVQVRITEGHSHTPEPISYCEYFTTDSHKSKGIEWVINHLKLDGYQTMAFGDGENDPDMLAAVNHGVAMKNGCEEVFRVADATTKFTNVENGVAEYLKDYFL